MKLVIHDRKHPFTSRVLDLPLGSNLNGLRVSKVTFENWEEIFQLHENIGYLKHIRNAMLTKEQQSNMGIKDE